MKYWQSAQLSCLARSVSTDSENPPVCLLLAFRWQCVRGVFFTYSRYTNVHLLTYLLTWLVDFRTAKSCRRPAVKRAQFSAVKSRLTTTSIRLRRRRTTTACTCHVRPYHHLHRRRVPRRPLRSPSTVPWTARYTVSTAPRRRWSPDRRPTTQQPPPTYQWTSTNAFPPEVVYRRPEMT